MRECERYACRLDLPPRGGIGEGCGLDVGRCIGAPQHYWRERCTLKTDYTLVVWPTMKDRRLYGAQSFCRDFTARAKQSGDAAH